MTRQTKLQSHIDAWAERIERSLDELLPGEAESPPVIHRSMRYSALGGGKRLRGILAVTACEAAGGDGTRALPLAAALEMIHAYSLVHDDLPAMDDDAMRRGKPTNHIKFGEGIAVLAGDALLTHAFIVLSHLPKLADVSEQVALRIVAEVAQASGTAGLIGGQVADLEAEGRTDTLSADELRAIHARKTGALFRTSVRAGALLAGADATTLDALTRYANALGIAFQIADDVLDVIGNEQALGKRVGSDADRGKTTYPALFGLERAKEMALAAVAEADDALTGLGADADMLRQLARFAALRDH